MRLGLTGGIGSGKSVAAGAFADLGAFVIDTDVLAREAVAPDSDGLAQIARYWPSVVRGGVLDRAALGEIVFHDESGRRLLNDIVHPHVRRLAQEREERALPRQLVVHVAPLLFETGYSDLRDKSALVVAPESDRIARVTVRDGSDEATVRARMAAQMDPDDARLRANFVIFNDRDLAHLFAEVRAIYEKLMPHAAD